jgi:hypothetical protein
LTAYSTDYSTWLPGTWGHACFAGLFFTYIGFIIMPMLLKSPTFTIPQSIMTIMGNAGLFRDQQVRTDPDAGMLKLDLQS